MSAPVNTNRWGLQSPADDLNEFDFDTSLTTVNNSTGVPVFLQLETGVNSFSGTTGSACFAMAINLETSNGVEISGLNAEEQSDISLLAQWSGNQAKGVPNIEVYSYYDAMIILRENNVLELIQ